MDSLISDAGRALAAGDPLGALKLVALRDDPPALALRGIAMAQLGDFVKAQYVASARSSHWRVRAAWSRKPRWRWRHEIWRFLRRLWTRHARRSMCMVIRRMPRTRAIWKYAACCSSAVSMTPNVR